MKKLPSIKAFLAIIAIIITVLSANKVDSNKCIDSNTIITQAYILGSKASLQKINEQIPDELSILVVQEETKIEKKPKIVYDGLTLEELSNKLERNLKSTLTGYGKTFAEYSLKYEVDPYLALAIVLHETGCGFGKCSTLASQCNNIGGMKGSLGCGGGSYKKFDTLEAGIEAFFRNLSRNYYQKGLTTPETIGKKYAESTTWPERIHHYINKIKNS